MAVLALKAVDQVWVQNEGKFSTVEELDGDIKLFFVWRISH